MAERMSGGLFLLRLEELGEVQLHLRRNAAPAPVGNALGTAFGVQAELFGKGGNASVTLNELSILVHDVVAV